MSSTSERTRAGAAKSICDSCGAPGVELIQTRLLGADSCPVCTAERRGQEEGIKQGILHVVGEAVAAARFACTPDQIKAIVVVARRGGYHTDHAYNVAATGGES